MLFSAEDLRMASSAVHAVALTAGPEWAALATRLALAADELESRGKSRMTDDDMKDR